MTTTNTAEAQSASMVMFPDQFLIDAVDHSRIAFMPRSKHEAMTPARARQIAARLLSLADEIEHTENVATVAFINREEGA